MSTPAPGPRTRGSPAEIFRRICIQAGGLLAFATIAAFATARFTPAPTTEGPHEITLAEVSSVFAKEKILWIDARPAAAFAAGHVPGAVWLAEESWEEGLPKFVEAWTPGQPIVVYCSSTQCGSSRSVARRLVREFSATRVYFLQGGWDALQMRP